MESIGSLLIKARKRKKLSLEKVAKETRIKKEYLEALEKEEFDILPAGIYSRAFLGTYAQYLGLEAEKILEMYKQKKPFSENKELKLIYPQFTPRHQRKSWAGLLLFLVLVAVIIVFLSQLKKISPEILPPPKQEQLSEPMKETLPQVSPGVLNNTVSLKTKVLDDCWLRLKDGDKVIFEGNLAGGEEKNWESNDKFVLRINNAANIELTVNGNFIGPVGKEGEFIHALVITPDEIYFE